MSRSPIYISDTLAIASGGADKSITVPQDREYKIDVLKALFTTASGAGTHQLYLTVDRGDSAAGDTEPYIDVRAGLTQAQSLSYYYDFAPDVPLSTAVSDTDQVYVPIPDVWLPSGWVIRLFDQSAVATSDDVLEIKALVKIRDGKSST